MLPADEGAGNGVVPPWASVRSFALAAEDSGLDSVWMFDHFFHQPATGPRVGMYEAWTTVSAIAAVTNRVQVGTLVLCSPFRNPGLLAKMASTADAISGGRLVLGVGAGWHDPEFAAFGYAIDHRVARFAEALPIIAALLRGESVTVAGHYYDMRGAELLPPPARRIPILVAAEGPRMTRLAAKHADAWVTARHGEPDERLVTKLAAMSAALDAEGRDESSLTRVVGVLVQDPDRGSTPDPADRALSGSADDLARSFDAYEALGIDHLVIQPLPHDERSLERLVAAAALRGGH